MSDATSSRVPDLVNALTLEEKAALTAGVDMWATAAVPRLGIPAVQRHRRPQRRPGHGQLGPSGAAVGLHAVRVGARCHVGPDAGGRGAAPSLGGRGPRPRVPGACSPRP